MEIVKRISLQNYGKLEFSTDGWRCCGALTPIGPVDVDLDGDIVDPEAISKGIISVLDRMAEIDTNAKQYLQQHAPEDVERANGLFEPCLFFDPNENTGTFTIFYSGTNPDDEMCYGVDFDAFRPINLVIGD